MLIIAGRGSGSSSGKDLRNNKCSWSVELPLGLAFDSFTRVRGEPQAALKIGAVRTPGSVLPEDKLPMARGQPSPLLTSRHQGIHDPTATHLGLVKSWRGFVGNQQISSESRLS